MIIKNMDVNTFHYVHNECKLFLCSLQKRLMGTKVVGSIFTVAELLSKKYSLIFHYDTGFAYFTNNIRWPNKTAVTYIEPNPS